MAKNNKRTCGECHYLALLQDNDYSLLIKPARHRLLEIGWDTEKTTPCCRLENWSGDNLSTETIQHELTKDRADCLEFALYDRRISFEAMQRRQEIESDKAKLQKTTKIAIAAIVVTAIASVLTLAERLFEFAVARNWIQLP